MTVAADDITVTDWYDDLLWCPSQCYLNVTWPDGTPACLYMRWRWDDPWQLTIVSHATRSNLVDGEWEDVYVGEFTAEQISEAKAALLAEFRRRCDEWEAKV